MKIINENSIKGTDRDTTPIGCRSLRLIIKDDNMGFGVHKTIIPKGGPHHWHYMNHLEACYCISGYAILTNLETGEEFKIYPGVIYLLDAHDDHTFTALEETVLLSVFNPPLNGTEVHDENGVYKIIQKENIHTNNHWEE
jgi:L-ectoine synthase